MKDMKPQYITAFILLAFLVKALVPVGFMPGEGTDGKIEIVICTGQGAVTQLVDISHSPYNDDEHSKDEHQDSSSRQTCPYAPVLAQDVNTFVPASLPAVYPELFSFRVLSEKQNTLNRSYNAQAPPVLLA